MDRLTSSFTRRTPRRSSPWRGLAVVVGSLAWVGAALVAAVMAVVFAATMVVIAVMASVLLVLAVAAVKANSAVRRASPAHFLEARRVGGHSWVAYGWDRDL
jgi:cytochrome c oxidase assembly factor CtaG